MTVNLTTFRRREVCASVFVVTPEIAKAMLSLSKGNRRTRPSRIKSYAAAMQRGEWIVAQPIIFDAYGVLIDGHHRLMAVVIAGVTVEFVVLMGIPPAATTVMDTGSPRSVADLMRVDQRIAKIIRFAGEMATGDGRPTIAMITPYAEGGILEQAEALIDQCGSSRRGVGSAPVCLAACVAAIDGGDPEYVRTVYRQMALSEYQDMPRVAASFIKQIDSGKVFYNQKVDMMARAFIVFDRRFANIPKLAVSEQEKLKAQTRVRKVLEECKEFHIKTSTTQKAS